MYYSKLQNIGQLTETTEVLNVLSNPVMIADADYRIQFANEAAMQMFAHIEDDIRLELPNFKIENIIGGSIDQFHKNPAHQRGILKSLTTVHHGKFSIAGKHLSFKATPRFDEGQLREIYVEWQDRTDIVESERNVSLLMDQALKMADAHYNGMINHFIDSTMFNASYAKVAESINEMVQGHIETKKKIVACANAYAQGNFDYELERFSGDRGFLNDAMDNISDSFRDVVHEIQAIADDLNSGNLDHEFHPEQYNGSFRKIIEVLQSVANGLIDTVSDIAVATNEIAEQSVFVNSASDDLASNTQIQAAAVEEVSASSEQTEQMVRTNASASTSALNLVKISNDLVSAGSVNMDLMKTAMDEIQNSSTQIAKLVKVIDEIAFQTNLLALNAAVEAARAGQHGRGFAVVATEVRSLAGRSAKAASDTEELISIAGSRVETGVSAARIVTESFDEIRESISQMGGLIDSIAQGSEEQSRGVSQINTAIVELSHTTSNNSEKAEGLSQAASNLKFATGKANELLKRFKLPERRKPAATHKYTSLQQIPEDLLRNIIERLQSKIH